MNLTPHHYYAHPVSQPRLCELDEKGFVYWTDSDIVRHCDNFKGRFVRLVEVAEPTPVAVQATPRQGE